MFCAIGQDTFGTMGRTRIKTDRVPFFFLQSELIPYWSTDLERAIALEREGWFQGATGRWIKKPPRPTSPVE